MKLFSFLNKFLTLSALFFIGLNPVLADTVSSSVSVVLSSSTSAGDIINSDENLDSKRELISEPNIRVGLYKTNDSVKFSSDFIYDVWINGEIVGTLLAQDTAVLSYKKGTYSFKSESLTVTSTKYFRLVPQDQQSFFTLVSYSRPVKGRGKINFNVYRGVFEYRYSPKSQQPYIINELPLDQYVAGVAETYNTAPTEYVKALMVAARSYANALISKNPPTDKRLFDVYPTTADQLYLGYNSELFMPKVAQAAADTAGEMVVYNGNPVITPYFSHSSGATKNWKSSDRPWLKSVKAIYDKGKKMSGHGFGMSNYDAEKHALKDGWTYDQILKYYYTSTTVERVF
ncbi:MAG TPA: SpoIID/LytB domain-containing protein [Candidatus Udaeobacter sp.]|nr:SpoIID/LytB domain-containing protein [Candidatus Udaeobacter sp.]